MKNKMMMMFLALGLSSCQLGPFYYTFPPEANKGEEDVHFQGQHGAFAGQAYMDSVNACLLSKSEEEMTDEEWANENWEAEGQGYYDGKWSATHPDDVAIQQVFQGENGELYILEDDGEIVEIAKLHIIKGDDGKTYIWDDEKEMLWRYEFDDEVA